MSYSHSIILGIVQGLTEFLPISSSGHLVLVQELLGIKQPGMAFEIFAHLGTLVAVFIVYKREIWNMIAAVPALFNKSYRRVNDIEQRKAIRMIGLVTIASIPTAIIGILFKPIFETLFESVKTVGYGLIVTGFLLWAVENKKSGKKGILKIRPLDAILVGVVQGCAIVPGISRSGSTISASLFVDIERETAAKYSLILSIPPILGSALLDIKDFIQTGAGAMPLGHLGIVFISSALSGLLAIKLLLRILKKESLKPFSFYCWALALVILILL
ncbi:MAG TPA: undecaprenyl-diphosphate phosphatase [Clostridia bacterium]|nr:undecaprenyl-diphosphate phosphatase [Clostridia bacterium]